MKLNLKKTLNRYSVTLSVMVSSMLMVSDLQAQVTDKVLVIVNDDVITQSELDFRLTSLRAEFAQTERTLPDNVEKQLLDSMINDRIQIQEADRRGLEVTDQELDEAVARFAQQQGQTVEQLEQSLGGVDQVVERFRQTVKESLIISRLTEFYANNRVFVPEYEIEGAMSQNKLGDDAFEYQIAHIFIQNIESNKEKAETIRQELVDGSGESRDFMAAAAKYSQAPDVEKTGGLIGWKTADQLPEIFAAAVKDIEVGGVSEVLESANGLHILKLVDRKGEFIEILQNNVRHILIEAEGEIAIKQATKKLQKIKARILAGEDFDQLARIHSDDSVSAATGGSLEWVNPGQMVAPFEEAFKQLPINEISDPVVTEFGVHLIQVVERRQENVTDIVMKNRVRGVLRRQRANREFSQWVRQLKEQAYISHVAGPSAEEDDKVL